MASCKIQESKKRTRRPMSCMFLQITKIPPVVHLLLDSPVNRTDNQYYESTDSLVYSKMLQAVATLHAFQD